MSTAAAGKDNKESTKVTRARVLKKGLFAKDLGPMMYGFGDKEPSADTINVMEELLVEHITDVCTQAHRISTNRGKIKVDDFKFALRKDPKKLARVEELLFMSEVIARARGKDEFQQYAEEEKRAQLAALAAGGAEPVPVVAPALPPAAPAAASTGASTKAKGKAKA
ncbi:transcription initiation factor TFIID subunit 13 [Pseudohyphozyma bogoriensis]|nr:transcription initiation factor TFIID subunit 13 [Pseudohyphozyma bogoriensis]